MVLPNKTKSKIKKTIPSAKGHSESRKVTASKIKKPNIIKKAKLFKLVKNSVKKFVKKIKNKKIFKSKIKIVPQKKIFTSGKEKTLKLKKTLHNPIIKPSKYSWESKATFNPTAFEHEGKIHIVYRAIGEDDSSVLGYAYTKDGLNIEGRPTYHIYKRLFNYNENVPKINYLSGGGWSGGCEDPRLVVIDSIVYMIFTAFDGWGSVRLALTSIKLDDFINKKWKWKKAVMISPPGEINKNWVLFPEKINGKFAIVHSFYPRILIDYFDNLDELNGKKFIKSNNTRPVDKTRGWDSWFRGIGPSPIKTTSGWLVLYHAMDYKNPDRYRLGAMLLDLSDPTKVLYRSQSPILEPEEDYENNGHKWGVVYSCGAVVKNGVLFVYYGGADKFVCVASMKLEELIDDLMKDKEVKLIKTDKK